MIRAVEAGQKDQWLDLFNGYAEFYKVSLDQNTHQNVWSWIQDQNESFWCDGYVSEEGRLLGFTQYSLIHRSLSGGKVVYLSDLYVLPEFRGQGIARALIDHVFEFARRHGYSNVRWLTAESNYTARQLYDSYQTRTEFVLYSINT
ncbi:MAG: GNAT family N-acetyltransferase [Gammaproteobacteria bacterium]|nr:GNAT family N-acetyltransferase [Gammaproteobacteria bacterium]